MAQHDYSIANGTGAAVRSDLNDALSAIVSLNSGASEPATTFAFQLWADTTNNLLKLRNSANNAWITLRQLDGDFSTVSVDNGTAAAPSVFFNASGTDTGFYSSGTDAVDVSTAGTRRLGVGSSGDVTVFGGNVTLNAQGDLRFADSDSSNWVAFQAPATVASNVTWTLPDADGTADQALTTNGLGVLSWADAGGVQDNITEGNTSAEVVDTGSDGHFKVITEGTEALRINASQQVGIGTSPAAKFHVKLNTNENIHFVSYGSGDQRINARNDANNANVSLTLESSELLFRRSGGTESARLDSSGRLLVNNSAPFGTSSRSSWYSLIQIRGNTTGTGGTGRISIGTGTAASTNTELGDVYFCDSNGGDRALIRAYSTSAGGSENYPGHLTFWTNPGQANPVERVRIDKDGELSTFNGTSTHFRLQSSLSAGTANRLIYGAHSSTGYGSGTECFRVYTNGNVANTNGSYGSLSDIKLKENIVDAGSQWDDLKAIQVRNYNFKEETGHQTHTQLGVIAQEVELVSPGLVTESPDRDAEGNDLGTVTKSVSYSVLYMKAVKALQEAMTRIETLEAKVAALEAA